MVTFVEIESSDAYRHRGVATLSDVGRAAMLTDFEGWQHSARSAGQRYIPKSSGGNTDRRRWVAMLWRIRQVATLVETESSGALRVRQVATLVETESSDAYRDPRSGNTQRRFGK